MKHTLKMKKIKKRKNLGDQSRLEYLDEQIWLQIQLMSATHPPSA